MERSSWCLLALGVLLASGCGPANLAPLRPRAAFDLNCPEEQIEMIAFPGDTAGVRGCGRRASFRRVCAIGPFGAPVNCAWLLQSAIVDDEPRPASQPPRWERRGDPVDAPVSNTSR